MALALQSTLVEMTADVLSAIGEGGTGVAAPATEAMVQSLLRRANLQMQDEAPWLISWITAESLLVAGETTIEWPDQSQPGRIHTIEAMAEEDPTDRWALVRGITPELRAAWLNLDSQDVMSRVPSSYELLNGIIEVGPACDSNVTIVFQYSSDASLLLTPDARPSCDALCIVMQAEILFRNARGGDFRNAIPKLQADLMRRLELLKPRQSTGRTVIPGGAWVDPARRMPGTTQRHWADRNRRP